MFESVSPGSGWMNRREHSPWARVSTLAVCNHVGSGATMNQDTYTKILLDESEMPTRWYNIVPDLPSPPPPALHPGTLQPAGPDDFAPLFPMAIIMQEVSQDRYVDIPGAVLDVYRLWRPSPLFRAHRLEKALGTPAQDLLQVRGGQPGRVAQAEHRGAAGVLQRQEGITKLTTETGAGQWGTALGVRDRPIRAGVRGLAGCRLLSAEAVSPHDDGDLRGDGAFRARRNLTDYGRSLLAADPNHPGSLGIAISEAVAMAVTDPKTRYALGQVLNHVLMHQTIIGEEALLQLAKVGETPDLLVGCTGGGSNFGGLSSRSFGRRWPAA